MSLTRKLILLISFSSLFLGVPILNILGYSLNSSTGLFYFKLHPATYFALFTSLSLSMYRRRWRTVQARSIALRYILVIICIIAYQVVSGRSNELSFIANTLLTPALFLLFAPVYDFWLRNKVRLVIWTFFILNSFVAIFERLISFNFFPLKDNFREGFRSSAFQGHPLNNALIIAIIISFIFICDRNIKRKRILIFLGMLSLVCFGTRGALYITIAGFGAHLFFSRFSYDSVRYKEPKNKSKQFNVLYVILSVVTLSYLVLKTKLGERLVNISFFDEGSAGVRLAVWGLFKDVSIQDLLTGIDEVAVNTAMERTQIEIIENFWVIWVFRFGLILTVLLAVALCAMLLRPLANLKAVDRYYLIFVFLGVASTNNSLASNTTAITIFVICTYTFLKPLVPRQLTSLRVLNPPKLSHD